MAAAITLLIASLVLSGCLFDRWGYGALAIGGGGVCLTLGAIILALKLKPEEVKDKPAEEIIERTENVAPKKESHVKPVDKTTHAFDHDISYISNLLAKSDCNIEGKVWLDGFRHFAPLLADLALQYPHLHLLKSDDFIVSTQKHHHFRPEHFEQKVCDELPLDKANGVVPIFWHVSQNHWAMVLINLGEPQS